MSDLSRCICEAVYDTIGLLSRSRNCPIHDKCYDCGQVLQSCKCLPDEAYDPSPADEFFTRGI